MWLQAAGSKAACVAAVRCSLLRLSVSAADGAAAVVVRGKGSSRHASAKAVACAAGSIFWPIPWAICSGVGALGFAARWRGWLRHAAVLAERVAGGLWAGQAGVLREVGLEWRLCLVHCDIWIHPGSLLCAESEQSWR